MSVSPGTRLGPYEITARIGAGGMGEVWRARDTRLERDVALKVLPAEALADETARARLVREARLASKLNHPHICTIYDVGDSDPSTGSPLAGSGQAVCYIAMELVEGQSLSDRVAHGALPVEEVLRYGQQLAGALAHAHARGVVHRDFKSANVVVTPEGQVKVLDFGLAKRLAGDEIADAATASRQSLTEAGVLAGTLAYMAPEQLRGRPADARSDIWALGIVLYELATGKRPFEGKTGFELSSAILSQPVPAVPSSVPAPLAGVIDRCLAKEPGDRYQRGGEVQAALEAAASGQAVAVWPARRVAPRRHRALAGTVAGAFALVAIAGGAAAPARAIRLAVLPFANLSGDAEQEYLSDGLTTEMIAQLGRLHPGTLSVIARTSVMRYKKTEKAIDQIGRELGVDYVLEGSAQREAGRIRITADLIKVADQTQLWAERYERDMAGILALQSDVAQKVAGALALKLLPGEQARLGNARAVNPEAYEAYLKGSQYWIKMTPGDLDTAQRYFEAALKKDPDYAAAYTGLAWVWGCRSQMGLALIAEAGPKMREATLKALSLDDGLGEAHYALATILTWHEWNFQAADAEWKRAVQLDPNYPDGLAMYSHFLMIVGRPDEAMAQIDRALKLDPFNVTIHSFYAIDLLLARRYDDAITQARKTLKMQPDNSVASTALILSLHMSKRYEEAMTAAATLYASPMFGWPDVADALKKGYAEVGYAGALRATADLETAKYGTLPGVANDAAMNYLMAGDTARAFEWFEKAFKVRDPNLPYLNAYPLFDPLRSDPRLQSLLRRIGLAK
jgi:TolB-like protein/Tfp pilus assembly protein PilF/tRNA A-37 threonylcarbamoyl transferase component Bud32